MKDRQILTLFKQLLIQIQFKIKKTYKRKFYKRI